MSEQVRLAPARSVKPMVRFAFILMIIGFVNAIASVGVTFYFYSGHQLSRNTERAWDNAFIWLWPTGIMMAPMDTSGSFARVIILIISIVANACVYACVGFVIGAIWQKVAKEATKE